MKRGIILAAVLAATSLAGPALAADLMPRKAPPMVAPPIQDWSGIYVGLEVGYGWGRQDGLNVPFTAEPGVGEFLNSVCQQCGFDPFFELHEFQDLLNRNSSVADVLLGRTKQTGWLAGGFFGAQKQWGNWVLGLEGDIDGANIKGSVSGFAARSGGVAPVTDESLDEFLNLRHAASLESKVDLLASVRGKVGFAASPNWLIYGTGGMAFAHVKNTLSSAQSLAFGDDCIVDGGFSDCEGGFVSAAKAFSLSSGTSMFGWAAGFGTDWKVPIDAGSAWVFGLEYLHYGFPSQTITLSDSFGRSLSFNAKEDVDTIKARISYLFSIH
ncbi:MAG TPA: hypothetical protein VGF60_02325 [Xanthobacteraceae bacterium]|jgi:outer membrane immunogenic protein